MLPGKKSKAQTAEGKKLFLKTLALPNVFGLIARASKKCHISQLTHYIWTKADPTYAAQVKVIRDLRKDFVEHKLFEMIEDKDGESIRFAARCLNREEYTPDLKVVGDTDQPLTIKMPQGLIEEAMKTIYSEKHTDVKPEHDPPK